MNMRALIVGPQQKARAAEILAYAEAHPYIIGKQQPVPGDNPAYVAYFNSYRVVFTYTHSRGEVFRHMTVGVPGKAYPNPFAVWMLAETFGFTGWDGVSADVPKDWQFDLNQKDRCITLVQKIVK